MPGDLKSRVRFYGSIGATLRSIGPTHQRIITSTSTRKRAWLGRFFGEVHQHHESRCVGRLDGWPQRSACTRLRLPSLGQRISHRRERSEHSRTHICRQTHSRGLTEVETRQWGKRTPPRYFSGRHCRVTRVPLCACVVAVRSTVTARRRQMAARGYTQRLYLRRDTRRR